MMFLGCICRWDDSWANKSIIHGRNLDGVGQLHHIPNSKMLVPVLPCHGRHHHDVPSTTSSWNFRALRWRCSALWRSSCISRPARAHSRVFWSLRVQVPWSKRHCGFSAGGELAPLPSPRIDHIPSLQNWSKIPRPPLHYRGWKLKETSLFIGRREPLTRASSLKSTLYISFQLEGWTFSRAYNA